MAAMDDVSSQRVDHPADNGWCQLSLQIKPSVSGTMGIYSHPSLQVTPGLVPAASKRAVQKAGPD